MKDRPTSVESVEPVEPLGEKTPAPYGLGRLVAPDSNDFRYLTRYALEREKPELPSAVEYSVGPALNQGKTSECVGYSWEQYLRAEPVAQVGPGPRKIYCGAQKNDPWPGDCSNPRYEGSTVRGGAKWLREQGYLSEYLWAFTVKDISEWLRAGKGPVVVGTMWYNSMFEPGQGGLLTVDVRSGDGGGHAYLCIGANEETQLLTFINSWGAGWGDNGKFKIRYQDMEFLMNQYGEACTAKELLRGTEKVEVPKKWWNFWRWFC